ncbi:class F sortase [Kitasatospora sp. NPDC057223]|uniref:class F sortase n=1 Tax=Kitasatospora sp. NPDC057223 TaxID=3346055 RepID=UPI003626DF03
MPAHRADRTRRSRRPSWAPAAAAGSLSLALAALVLLPAPEHAPVRIEYAGRAPEPATAPTGPGIPGTAAPAPTPVPTAPTPDPAAAASPPVRLLIPGIGVDAPVEGGGLNPDGTVEVPPADRPGQVDWYREGPAPGQTGPAVILGHLDTRKGPAVFHRLPQLRPGDRIDIRRQDGSTVTFRVRELRQAPKSGFPTQAVYGNTDTPQLRLVTCGGKVAADGHYTDNIIVLADLAPTG